MLYSQFNVQNKSFIKESVIHLNRQWITVALQKIRAKQACVLSFSFFVTKMTNYEGESFIVHLLKHKNQTLLEP